MDERALPPMRLKKLPFTANRTANVIIQDRRRRGKLAQVSAIAAHAMDTASVDPRARIALRRRRITLKAYGREERKCQHCGEQYFFEHKAFLLVK